LQGYVAGVVQNVDGSIVYVKKESGDTIQVDARASSPKRKTRTKMTTPDYPALLPRDHQSSEKTHPGFENMDDMLHLHE
jgi:hypothetical protein